MSSASRKTIALGAIIMFMSVAAGAFGAHGVKHMLSEALFAVYETAVRYQSYHGLAILIVGVLLAMPAHYNLRLVTASVYCFLLGIFAFSGSLYCYVFSGIKVFAMITPVGGVLFLVGWVLLALGVRSSKNTNIAA